MNVRVGVIGAGIMGSDHARTLSNTVKGTIVTAVSDTDPDRAAAVASVAGAHRVHVDGHALIADHDVDAVLIASPDSTHEDLVLACLDAGKPVLCEKPLAPSANACLRVIAAETALGRRLVQVGFMRRLDPAYATLREAVHPGSSVHPCCCIAFIAMPVFPPSFDAGMVITNSAVHEIDIARWLLHDEFASVTVFGRGVSRFGFSRLPQLLVLESRNRILVEIEVFVSARYGYDVRAELVCEAGIITWRRRRLFAPVSRGRKRHSWQTIGGRISGCLPYQLQAGSTRSVTACRSAQVLGTAMSRRRPLRHASMRFRAAPRRDIRLAPRPTLYG